MLVQLADELPIGVQVLLERHPEAPEHSRFAAVGGRVEQCAEEVFPQLHVPVPVKGQNGSKQLLLHMPSNLISDLFTLLRIMVITTTSILKYN